MHVSISVLTGKTIEQKQYSTKPDDDDDVTIKEDSF